MITIIAIAVVIGIVAYVLRKSHIAQRKEERRCKHGKDDKPEWTCCLYTTRHYLMVSDDKGKMSRWGRPYQPYVIDECPDEHYTSVPKKPKFFSHWQLVWRHVLNPKQFLPNEELLTMAGIILEAVPSTMDRVRKHAEDARLRAGHLKAKLDRPPNPSIRVQIFTRQHVTRISLPTSVSVTSKSPKD